VPGQDTPATSTAPERELRNRREVVRIVQTAEEGRAAGRSVRRTAAAEGVAPSVVYHMLARKAAIDAPAAERDFFVSPEGLAVLHRIHVALHLVFVQAGGCGVDRVCEFLELSHLDRFIAASHGTQNAFAEQMAILLGEYADEQRARLGPRMRPLTIVVCEDETFHPHEMCLVAIEPESGMILLECYCERRDGETWTARLAEALDGLPVRVVMVVGDEAKGLIAHARNGLGCAFGPDLFHPQHDLSQATSLPLARRLEPARQAVADAEGHTEGWREARARYDGGPRPPGRRMDYERRIDEAETAEKAARADYDAIVQDQADVRAAIRGIGNAYHPFDLATGAMRTAETVRELFAAAFATIDAVADRGQLSNRCRDRINKARRVMPKLVGTVAFFHGQLERALAELALSPAILEVVRSQLVPGLYLQRAARRARTAADRATIAAVSQSLLAQAYGPTSPFMALDQFARDRIEAVALATVQLFVRSSACVEGRNGHLARYHHGLHHLSKRRLKSLTAIANYYTRRADGSTAAQRFFGQKPDDLFDWLLARLDVPAQPRSSRLKVAA